MGKHDCSNYGCDDGNFQDGDANDQKYQGRFKRQIAGPTAFVRAWNPGSTTLTLGMSDVPLLPVLNLLPGINHLLMSQAFDSLTSLIVSS